MPKPTILYATTNNHKIRLFEISWKAQSLDQKFELLTLKDVEKKDLGHVVEDSGSFTGDALLKAIAYSKAYNLPTISQDRGFIFDAINWPGTDTKKAFTLDESKIVKKGEWDGIVDEYFQRSKEILAKIEGLDRAMTVTQGLAIAIPSGKYIVEEFKTKGKASLESKISISGAGGMYDWFFIPQGLTHTISEFTTKEAQDNYVALNLYPITPKIINFLEELNFNS